MPHAQGHILVRRRPRNGNDGNPGLDGCILRVSEWAKNVHYTNDESKNGGIRYIDIAVVTTGAISFQCYKCILEHDSSDSITYTNTKYWQKFNKMQPIYTPLIMAQNALLRFTQTNQLLVMKSDNSTVAAGMGGGNFPLWVGAITPDKAPFRVSIDGKLTATDADITGTINARSGKIGGMKISGDGLTNEGFNNDAYMIFRNDNHRVFVGVGCNILPASSGFRGVARFENEDDSNYWGLGANYGVLISVKGSRSNIAINADGGSYAGFAWTNKIVDGGSYNVGRGENNIICINTSKMNLRLPAMRLCDDGHTVRVKRLAGATVNVYSGSCDTYNGSSIPCIIYDRNATADGWSGVDLISEADASEFVWCRDIIRTVGNKKYYGAWIQYKIPRDW